MDIFVMKSSGELSGTVAISGSKNAALPILAAGILSEGPSRIHNVPELADIAHTVALLGDLGVKAERTNGTDVTVEVTDESNSHAAYERVRKMRASICVLGPLLAKRGVARVSMPGGCAIGSRPVDLHLRGMEALGATIELDGGDIIARADRLRGAEIFLGGPFGSTVLGTANVMCAAALAEGHTVIESAACEPEVVDLADYLNAMGAKIRHAGTPRIEIEGVRTLRGAEHTVIPDRIEAGTFMIAGAITCGRVVLKGARLDHLMGVVAMLRRIGVHVDRKNGDVVVWAEGPVEPIDITTQAYPGFPTDLQAQMMSLLALAEGNSAIVEKIYPDRFMHVAELLRMGANIRKEGSVAIVTGVKQLIGAPVMASDLRASAALVIAGLVARGETTIRRVYHIDRGYEQFEVKLRSLGAKIERKQE